jgi:hypothetical protein
MTFSAQPPDLHRLSLDRESFAAFCPLALLGSASYPIPVRQLADSLAAAFSRPLALAALRFTWVATINFPKDFHLRAIGHAGHTKERGAGSQPAPHPFRQMSPRRTYIIVVVIIVSMTAVSIGIGAGAGGCTSSTGSISVSVSSPAHAPNAKTDAAKTTATNERFIHTSGKDLC